MFGTELPWAVYKICGCLISSKELSRKWYKELCCVGLLVIRWSGGEVRTSKNRLNWNDQFNGNDPCVVECCGCTNRINGGEW